MIVEPNMETSGLSKLGKYELITRLAKGGMAEIYLARQTGLGSFSRHVVIKRLLPHLADTPRFIQMFVEEAQLAARIHHPNVVRIFDVGQETENFYIAMEYIEGLSVASLTKRAVKHDQPVPYPAAAEIVVQTLDGLHAAHELLDELGAPLGLVHRDVSPQNLMIDKTGAVKLVDFGIAKARGSAAHTKAGSIKGKVPYLSPEQCRGETLDRRSDLFSLGTVFVELLAGERVFERKNQLWSLKAITEEPIITSRRLIRLAPGPLVEVIERAHQRDREARYPTAAAMADAIREALRVLGHETSHETLAEYLEEGCSDLIAKQSETIASFIEDAESPTAPIQAHLTPSEISSSADIPAADSSEAKTAERKTDEKGGSRRLLLAVGIVLCALLGLTAALYWNQSAGPISDLPAITLMCPPYYGQNETREGLQPLADYLQKRLEREVKLIVPASYDDVVERIISGDVDIATLSPLPFVKLRAREPSVHVIAAQVVEGSTTFQSILITESESELAQIEDFRGKRFCYVDSSSTSGYLLPRHFLRKAGIDPDEGFSETRLSGSHTKVMLDVVEGRCDGGAVFSGALTRARALGVPAARIRLIAIAGQTPRGVVVAAPGVEAALVEQIKAALLDFDPERDLGRAGVSDVMPIDGFAKVRGGEFEVIEAAAREEGLIR